MIAVAEGYYSRPRETSLDDLATALGVTKSGVTPRLDFPRGYRLF
jgi:predicted DNA binding protein